MAAAEPLVAALAAVALAGGPVVRIEARDQAKAELELLYAHDLGAGWSGSHAPAPTRFFPPCGAFHPDESGVVVTGRSAGGVSKYDPTANTSVAVLTTVQVVKTKAMLRSHLSRMLKPQLIACLARQLRSNGPVKIDDVSASRVPFPRVGVASARYRVSFTATYNGETRSVVWDFVYFGQSRSEYALRLSVDRAAAASAAAFETKLARLLVRRTTA